MTSASQRSNSDADGIVRMKEGAGKAGSYCSACCDMSRSILVECSVFYVAADPVELAPASFVLRSLPARR